MSSFHPKRKKKDLRSSICSGFPRVPVFRSHHSGDEDRDWARPGCPPHVSLSSPVSLAPLAGPITDSCHNKQPGDIIPVTGQERSPLMRGATRAAICDSGAGLSTDSHLWLSIEYNWLWSNLDESSRSKNIESKPVITPPNKWATEVNHNIFSLMLHCITLGLSTQRCAWIVHWELNVMIIYDYSIGTHKYSFTSYQLWLIYFSCSLIFMKQG